MPQEEIGAMDEMAGGCLTFLARSNHLRQALAPLDQAAQGLMAELHEGGGGHAY